MSECFLCGNERGHHLGCAASAVPGLTKAAARAAGLLPQVAAASAGPADTTEVLIPGTMTTVPEEDIPAEPGAIAGQCEVEGCENLKFSTSPRAKYCADHKDPKNRKE